MCFLFFLNQGEGLVWMIETVRKETAEILLREANICYRNRIECVSLKRCQKGVWAECELLVCYLFLKRWKEELLT